MQNNPIICLALDSANFGGIESHVYQLSLGLKKIGINAVVIFLQDHGDHPLKSKLLESRINFLVLDGTFTQFKTTLRKVKPALCHSHGYKAGIYSRFACITCNIPCISSFHAGERCSGKLGLYDFIDRVTAALSTSNIAVSDEISKRIYARSTQINNFISTTNIKQSKGSKIGFVGRLSHEKSPETFIRLASNFPLERFAIYGDGPLRDDISKTAPDNCQLYGHVNMDNHWHELNILIICSYFEGLPLCLLEAMARGITVIAYDVGQINRVIENRKNGFIINIGDYEGLKNCLNLEIQKDSQKTQKIKQAASATIFNHYSTEALLPSYISIYETSINAIRSQVSEQKIVKKSQALTVLFVHYGDDWIRGSEICLINLVKNIKKRGINPIVWCNSDSLYQELKKNGITVEKQHFTILLGWNRPYFDVVNFFKLIAHSYRGIKKNKVDIIHTNGGAPNQWMLIAAKSSSTPIITQLHAPYQTRDRVTLSLRDPDIVVGVSNAVISPFLDPDKILSINNVKGDSKYRVIHNGIDLNPFKNNGNISKVHIREILNIGCDAFVIISVGSLIKRKGFDLLINAVSLLQKNDIPAELIIAGEGEERKNLESLCNELNIEDRVHFLGECNNVAKILQSEVDIYASGARDEAFGLVFAEAGAAGIACVAPRVGGIPEVILDEQTGILVDPESAEALYAALLRLYTSSELRKGMGNFAKHNILKYFSQEKNTDKFEMLYQELHQKQRHHPWIDTLRACLSPFISAVEFTIKRNC